MTVVAMVVVSTVVTVAAAATAVAAVPFPRVGIGGGGDDGGRGVNGVDDLGSAPYLEIEVVVLDQAHTRFIHGPPVLHLLQRVH